MGDDEEVLDTVEAWTGVGYRQPPVGGGRMKIEVQNVGITVNWEV